MVQNKNIGILILLVPIILISISCQRTSMSKIKPKELSDDSIVFKGKVKFRDEIKSINDSQYYWVVGFTENTIYRGNPIPSDTIWVDYIGTAHGWGDFSTNYEYILIATPSKIEFENFKTYKASYRTISTPNNKTKRHFEREVRKWEKYKKQKMK